MYYYTHTFASRQVVHPHDLNTHTHMKKFRHATKRSDAGHMKVHGMNKDLIWHVLYDDDIELIRDILLQVCSLSFSRSLGSVCTDMRHNDRQV